MEYGVSSVDNVAYYGIMLHEIPNDTCWLKVNGIYVCFHLTTPFLSPRATVFTTVWNRVNYRYVSILHQFQQVVSYSDDIRYIPSHTRRYFDPDIPLHPEMIQAAYQPDHLNTTAVERGTSMQHRHAWASIFHQPETIYDPNNTIQQIRQVPNPLRNHGCTMIRLLSNRLHASSQPCWFCA